MRLSSFTLIMLATSAFVCDLVASRSSYKKKLPNGDKTIGGSTALGHSNDSGGGARNAFGQAFASAGLKWTQELCKADTDGDGQTNGFELADPNCCFCEGATPAITEDLSHPGKASSTSSRAAAETKECPPCSSGTSNHGNIKSNFFTLVFATLASTLALIMFR